MEAWYTLYTKPNAEAQVARALAARGFEAYLPLLPTRSDERLEPLFPCYLFVHCDLDVLGSASLQWLPGLRHMVYCAGRPAVVPDAAIALIEESLRIITAQGGLPSHSFKPGDVVVIQEGALAGLRGVFQGPLGPAQRVRVLIRFLGHSNRAEVSPDLLRLAPEDGGANRPQVRQRGTRGHGRRINRTDRSDA